MVFLCDNVISGGSKKNAIELLEESYDEEDLDIEETQENDNTNEPKAKKKNRPSHGTYGTFSVYEPLKKN